MSRFNRVLKRHKVLVVLLIFAFADMTCFSGCSKPREEDRPAAASSTAPGADDPGEPCDCPPAEGAPGVVAGQAEATGPGDESRLADRLDAYLTAVRRSAAAIPRETFDPRAVAEAHGPDPRALFTWVRDRTVLVPYQGTLRGPRGVLLDRLGNSLDRALLLAELLRLAGHGARLAHGTLSPAQAEELLGKIPRRPVPALQTEAELRGSLSQALESAAAEHGLDAKELRSAGKAYIDGSLRQARRTRDDAEALYAKLSEAVGAASEPRVLSERERRAQRDSLRDHWWVQVEGESGWLDLDPSLPGAAPGETRADASELVRPGGLPEDVFHAVGIRIKVERWEAGRLFEETVLERSVRPCELLGETVSIRHYPLGWPADPSVFAGRAGARRLRSTVLEQTEWLPVLRIGTEQAAASSIKDTGEINKRPGRGSEGGVGGIAGGVFGALGGREDSPETKKNSILTAEWIDYEVRSPGRPVRAHTRQVFDLIGPAARKAGAVKSLILAESDRLERGLALLTEFDVLLQVCDLSPEFLADLTARRLVENGDALSDLLLGPASADEALAKIQQLTPLIGPEYGLASARGLKDPEREATYFGAPNIFAFVGGLRTDGREGIRSYRAFDIVENRLEVLPHALADAFEARLRQGVLDTVAESSVLRGLGAESEGAARLLGAPAARDVPWRVLRDVGDPNLAKLDLPEDVRTRIGEDLAAGYLVVAPSRPPRVADRSEAGWWRIDPGSGQALGLSAKGWGQAMTEHKLLWGFKIAGWTLCGIETVTAVAEEATGHTPHPVTALFLGSCWALGLTSMTMGLVGAHGVGAWVVVIVEVQSYFMGLGIHLGMSQGTGEKED